MPNELTGRQAVRMWLAQHDKTQRWLAGRLKISEPKLSDILSGHAAAPDGVRKQIAKVTGVDLGAFSKVA